MCHYFRMKLGKDPQREESEIGVGEGKIRQSEEEKEGRNPIWSVIYSDFKITTKIEQTEM